MNHTVVVDGSGWTLYEFEDVLTKEEALLFLRTRWYGPYDLVLREDKNTNPPSVWVEMSDKETEKRTFLGYIRERTEYGGAGEYIQMSPKKVAKSG